MTWPVIAYHVTTFTALNIGMSRPPAEVLARKATANHWTPTGHQSPFNNQNRVFMPDIYLLLNRENITIEIRSVAKKRLTVAANDLGCI